MSTTTDNSKRWEAEALRRDGIRCQALLSADAKLLASVVDEDLTYTHSSGRRDTKATYVDSVASGKTKYLSLEREGVTARACGDAVIVQGKVRMHVIVDGDEKKLFNHYLAVWTCRSGEPLMTAWASTKLG
jgi:hypothetical protein